MEDILTYTGKTRVSPNIEKALKFVRDEYPHIWEIIAKERVFIKPMKTFLEGPAAQYRVGTGQITLYQPTMGAVSPAWYVNSLVHEAIHGYETRKGKLDTGEKRATHLADLAMERYRKVHPEDDKATERYEDLPQRIDEAQYDRDVAETDLYIKRMEKKYSTTDRSDLVQKMTRDERIALFDLETKIYYPAVLQKSNPHPAHDLKALLRAMPNPHFEGKTPVLDEGYPYERTGTGHHIKVVRAGSEFSDPSRGGTWYAVEHYEGKLPGYYDSPITKGVVGVGGKQLWRKEIVLKKPYLFKLPEKYVEGEIPIKLWESVTKKQLISKKGLYGTKAEAKYAKMENETSGILKQKGYDGVIIYYEIGAHKVPEQVFVFSTLQKSNPHPVHHDLKALLKAAPDLHRKTKQEKAGLTRDYWDTHLENNPLRIGDIETSAAAWLSYYIEAGGDILRELAANRDAYYYNEKITRIKKSLPYLRDWSDRLNPDEIERLNQTKRLLEDMPVYTDEMVAAKGLIRAVMDRNVRQIAMNLNLLETTITKGQTNG